jgi:hypothetical protein
MHLEFPPEVTYAHVVNLAAPTTMRVRSWGTTKIMARFVGAQCVCVPSVEWIQCRVTSRATCMHQGHAYARRVISNTTTRGARALQPTNLLTDQALEGIWKGALQSEATASKPVRGLRGGGGGGHPPPRAVKEFPFSASRVHERMIMLDPDYSISCTPWVKFNVLLEAMVGAHVSQPRMPSAVVRRWGLRATHHVTPPSPSSPLPFRIHLPRCNRGWPLFPWLSRHPRQQFTPSRSCFLFYSSMPLVYQSVAVLFACPHKLNCVRLNHQLRCSRLNHHLKCSHLNHQLHCSRLIHQLHPQTVRRRLNTPTDSSCTGWTATT